MEKNDKIFIAGHQGLVEPAKIRLIHCLWWLRRKPRL